MAAFTVLFLIGFFARPDLLFEFGTPGRALIGLAVVFWVLMIVDAIQRLVRDTQYPRLQWLLAVLLTGVFGAVAYCGWRVTHSPYGGAAPMRHCAGEEKGGGGHGQGMALQLVREGTAR